MTNPPLQLDNPFWRFSLATYAQPGVAEACLALQAARGLDVNMLLFCAWLGAERHVAMTESKFTEAARAVEDWHRRVVVPLRNVRTEMKGMPQVAEPEIARLREAIKKVELGSEQAEQALLFAWAMRHWPQQGNAAPRTALERNIALCLPATSTDHAKPPNLAPLMAAALRAVPS